MIPEVLDFQHLSRKSAHIADYFSRPSTPIGLQSFYNSPKPVADNGEMRRTVLVIDDVDTCASTLELLFSGMPEVDVLTALSAERAWEILESAPVSAIVTDLEMQDMDGFELIQRIRSHPLHRAVPIMVITGSADPDAPRRAAGLGANAFFTKPYSAGLVRQKMEHLLTPGQSGAS
jgi:CheY-like chemotaxis protein